MRLTYQDYLAKLSLTQTNQTHTNADIQPSSADALAKPSSSDSLTLSEEAKARFTKQQNEINENHKQQAFAQAAKVLMGTEKAAKQDTTEQSAQDEITQAQIKYLKEQIKQAKAQLQKLAYKKHDGVDKQRAMLNMSVVMMTGQLLELMRKELPDATQVKGRT